MSCSRKGITHVLDFPVLYTRFVSYYTCKDTQLLAKYGMVTIKFPAVLTSTLPVSILDCDSNVPVYDATGAPLLSSGIVVGKPYNIVFNPQAGGYVLTNLVYAVSDDNKLKGSTPVTVVEDLKAVTKK